MKHKIVDPGHVHTTPDMVTEDSGFDINEHLAALPARVRGDYERAVKRDPAKGVLPAAGAVAPARHP